MERPELGPAETIISTLLNYNDHMVHNRPGVVSQDARTNVGVRWAPVTHKVEEDQKVVYRLDKVGRKTQRTRLGVMNGNAEVREGNRVVGEYRSPGIFPEVAVWMYKQVAEVWKLDNEFAARWASYSFGQEHKDLKTVLAAFMLVQSRKGEPVMDAGELAFFDDDYRDVGEAMCLIYQKGNKQQLDPKILNRIHDLLCLPEIAAINRELGFGQSARKPCLGRWTKVVTKWLKFREDNPALLQAAVEAGWKTSISRLCAAVGYKPQSPRFFEIMDWKQSQSKHHGARELIVGQEMLRDSWEGLDEEQICERIVRDKVSFKRAVGKLPKGQQLTRAIAAATIEAGGLSDKDLIILTPTLEELGLLQVQDIRERHEKAMRHATDQRASNIARNVKSKETREKLQEAADVATQKAVEEVVKDMRLYIFVDKSGSMTDSIPRAKEHIKKFLPAFPPERMHVATFNTVGREIEIRPDRKGKVSGACVEQAFRGQQAGGGTRYASGIQALLHHRPQANEETFFLFVGDEEETGHFAQSVRNSGLDPVAFGLVRVLGGRWSHGNGSIVRDTAARLGIPCFELSEEIFSDPYSVPRALRNMIAATPVGQTVRTARPRVTLVDQILKTGLLKKPAWA
jgi:hypothetical protein